MVDFDENVWLVHQVLLDKRTVVKNKLNFAQTYWHIWLPAIRGLIRDTSRQNNHDNIEEQKQLSISFIKASI